jgi:type VI secretion system protein VasJ
MSTEVNSLLKPVTNDAPQGIALEEHALLDIVEDEMMKYGTLRQSDIDWKKTIDSATTLLEKHSKDFKIMSSLIICWTSLENTLATAQKSLELLNGMIKDYWKSGFPIKGKNGLAAKNSAVLRSIKKINATLEKMAFNETEIDDIKIIVTSLQQTIELTNNFEIDEKGILAQLNQHLQNTIKSFTDSNNNNIKAKDNQSNKKKLSEKYPEKEIKSIVFDLSEDIQELTPEDPLSYQLRRYGIWFSITSAPPAGANNITELRPPPNDKVNEYKDQIYQGRVSYELLFQIENSLTLCPLWITGSLLSAQVLFLMQNDRAAIEIFHQIEALLKRLPTLQNLLFVGEIPFCDSQLYKELSDRINNIASQNTANQMSTMPKDTPENTEPDVKPNKSSSAAKLKSLIATEKKAFEKDLSARDSAYNKLEMLKKMKQIGMTSSAAEIADSTLDKISNMYVAEWEPDVFQKLSAFSTDQDNINQRKNHE